jgi:NADH dehydrogenase
VDLVTGAFSFTGRHVAERLLAQGREVRTLTRRPLAESPFGDRVEAFPLDVSDPAALRGVDTLYNTYWIRFRAGGTTFETAVANTVALFEAARAAGVRRVVQLGVTNADPGSAYAYFRGKAAVEAALASSGLSYAVVRPTLVFGRGEVLLNNVAWLLRRFPVFVLPGPPCRVQPVAVEDVAELCLEAAGREDDVVLDAAGPETFAFEEIVGRVREAVGSRARLLNGGKRTALALARLLGAVTRRTLVTREELGALGDDLLTSREPPRGRRRLDDWLAADGSGLGASLAWGERRPG